MYDTIDKENCYKGEPTTNLVEYSEYQYLADNYTAALGGWDTFEGSFLIDAINKVPGYTNRSIKMTSVQANVYKYHFNVSLTSGQTYTVSFWGKAQSAGTYGNFLLADGPSGYLVFEPGGYSSVTTEFTRFKYTFVVPTSGTYNFATYLYGDGQVVWLSGFQLENKSHATQYLSSNSAATSRSATQGLKDLAGTNQIDISTVSFDANAQIIFDGTDDYISCGNDSSLNILRTVTMELVFKVNGFGSPWTNVFGKMNADGDSNTRCYTAFINSAGYVHFVTADVSSQEHLDSTNFISTGVWYHWVGTINRNTGLLKQYVNGTLNSTAGVRTTDIVINSDPLKVGYIGNYYQRYNGDVALAKIYNRDLTQTEIAQNYNAIKSRFNLA